MMVEITKNSKQYILFLINNCKVDNAKIKKLKNSYKIYFINY